MKHKDRINLIKNGVINKTGYWADLGSGSGLFTMALAEFLSPPAKIFSIDKDLSALKTQKDKLNSHFITIKSYFITAGFDNELHLPLMDGILMANSLHYVREKVILIEKIWETLKPSAAFILVEYNTSRSNRWVPYPISFSEWQILSKQAGFKNTRLLGKHPSLYHKEIYAALSIK
jgi:SAM-dependent methyltransferase